ncbi:hypothetical protein GCM10007036_18030 [Alsobacter metallidurans]|uniref:Uncharacterized protein n=1 Tax=Alsobacter metallidurans TaxID=340221 RepID=A0A917MGS6_9HYPH|nr:hypothetical protein GCM10007036_18030 [Alsobacter metallidurans]
MSLAFFREDPARSFSPREKAAAERADGARPNDAPRRPCERSEAIQAAGVELVAPRLNCFVAPLLAMTDETRDHRPC